MTPAESTTFPASAPCPTCEAEVPARQDDCQECGMKIRVTEPMPASERIRVTLELMEAGIEHYRQWVSRKNPQATGAEIDAMVRAWLQEPGELPKGFTAYPAALCKHCDRLIAQRPAGWSHSGRGGIHCAGGLTIAEPAH